MQPIDDYVNTILDRIFKVTSTILHEDKELAPALLFCNTDADLVGVAPLRRFMETTETKNQLGPILAQIFDNMPDVHAYAMVSEAWTVTVPEETDVNTLPAPSKSPDRKEVVYVVLRVRDIPKPWVASFPMVRSGDDVTIEKGEVMHDGKHEGRFIQPPVPPEH